MALTRREALTLGAVAAGAAAAGLLVGPKLLERAGSDPGALGAAQFADLDGRQRSVAEWRGKVLVLNFWATWCAPCREEIPMLIAMRQRYALEGVEIVGIAVDSAVKVAEYVKSMQIAYPVLIADAGGGLDLMRRLGNQAGGLPYTVLIDRQGEPLKRKLGMLRQAELEAMLRDALRK